MVEHRGGTPSPIEAVPEDSVKYDKSPCSYCRANYGIVLATRISPSNCNGQSCYK